MILPFVAVTCFGLSQFPPKPFQVGETVLYESQSITQGRSSMHHAGLKLGEVTGFPGEGVIKVTPWDYLDRNYPGHVIGLDGKPKDGSETLRLKEVFHEVPCFQDQSGKQYTPGFERRLKVGRSRFESRHAMRVFENGAALFFRETRDEEAYSSLGNRLFFEKIAPTMIRTLAPLAEE